MTENEKFVQIEATLVDIRERVTRVETKLDNAKNTTLDVKTWAIVIAIIFGGGAANYGLQRTIEGQQEIKIVPAHITELLDGRG